DLVTPNLMEVAFLTGSDPIDTIEDMIRVGEKLRAMGPKAVLVKGGHLTGDILTDVLVTGNGVREFSSPKIATDNTHGTGCTLATAIAVGMGQGMDVNGAVLRGHDYVQKAIMKAPGYGCGKGPLNHLVVLD
ncbi:MAG TPA: bifunctional hydroxymethylpyrimidine kinase/phosphomethylpyrimidine kinase, partial [Sphingomonadales bacterium]|nr:bifunctional hydroxymethylpyrimidine kinase/phosphomethylpyrimidine kinase [Sphingomonadales bacterium]